MYNNMLSDYPEVKNLFNVSHLRGVDKGVVAPQVKSSIVKLMHVKNIDIISFITLLYVKTSCMSYIFISTQQQLGKVQVKRKFFLFFSIGHLWAIVN